MHKNTPDTKKISEWITDLNARAKNTKLLEENSKYLWPWFRQWFLRYHTKGKSDKIASRFHQIKNLFTANDTINKVKRQFTE